MADGESVHASCVILDEGGILIRGEPGAGKSSLARELVQLASSRGRFARLVSDDRTRLWVRHGRVLARPAQGIAGLVEIRGIGVVPVVHEPAAVLRLVVDLSLEEPTRLPETADLSIGLCGVMVPRLRLRPGAILGELVLARWSGFHDTLMTA
jgi:HPr kinase/phosphorylase